MDAYRGVDAMVYVWQCASLAASSDDAASTAACREALHATLQLRSECVDDLRRVRALSLKASPWADEEVHRELQQHAVWFRAMLTELLVKFDRLLDAFLPRMPLVAWQLASHVYAAFWRS